jgi:hypothetical protein
VPGIKETFNNNNNKVKSPYNLLYLFGKSWQDVNPTIDQRLDSYLALNDDMDPAYLAGSNTHIIGGSRTINTFAITATAMFGL